MDQHDPGLRSVEVHEETQTIPYPFGILLINQIIQDHWGAHI